MSNLERLNKEAELTVLKTQVVGQRLRVEKFRDALRLQLDTCRPPENLNRDSIQALVFDFSAAHIDLAETLALIAKIKNFLGQ
jgi:hypothetical protein